MKQFDPPDGPSIASVTDRVRPLAVGMPVTAVHFLGDTAVFVGAEENAALVNAGGDTRLLGDRRGKPWVVGIRDPDDESKWVTRLALDDEAISTSGDYERFFDEDGVRYHHILDPKSGKPVAGVRSVTIIGPDATLTDGLSTSVFVLGPERGLALIEATPGYAAVIIDAGRKVRFSKALAAD